MELVLIIAITIAVVVIGYLADRLYWTAKLIDSFFTNQNSKVMKQETNLFKQILGFLFTLLAGWLGYAEAPELVLSFGAILGAVYVIVDLIKQYVGPPWVQVVSWLIGILLSLGGWYLQLGIFVDMTWIFAAVTGFIISLAANGVYDSDWLEALWKLISGVFKPKK